MGHAAAPLHAKLSLGGIAPCPPTILYARNILCMWTKYIVILGSVPLDGIKIRWNSNQTSHMNPINLWYFQLAAELEETPHKGSLTIEDVFHSSSKHSLG